MKIAITTFHAAQNYGAFLQAYSLTSILKHKGHDVTIIDYRPSYLSYFTQNGNLPILPKYSQQSLFKYVFKILLNIVQIVVNGKTRKNASIAFTNAINHYLPLSETITDEHEIRNIDTTMYDISITGSDQVWNPKITGNKLDNFYFSQCFSKLTRKYSYGASCGNPSYLCEYVLELKKYLLSFNAISVRESMLKEYLESVCNKEVVCVLDPTLLLTRDEWYQFGKEPKNHPEKYILVYHLGSDNELIRKAHNVAKKLHLKIVYIHNKKTLFRYITALSLVSPEEFVWYFAHASLIITDSFHGTMFSIINRKPFYAIGDYPNSLRITDHLNRLGLSDRWYKKPKDIAEVSLDIDYGDVEKKLDLHRRKSLEFLDIICSDKYNESNYSGGGFHLKKS